MGALDWNGLIQIISPKFTELKSHLITEIKSRILLEKEKFKKKQKEAKRRIRHDCFQNPAAREMKLERDDLEHYARHVRVRIEDFSVVSEEPADSVYEKVGDSKVVCPSVLYWKGPSYRVGI